MTRRATVPAPIFNFLFVICNHESRLDVSSFARFSSQVKARLDKGSSEIKSKQE